MFRKKIYILFFILLTTLLSVTACTSNQDSTNLHEPPPEEPTYRNPDLDSHLNQLICAEERGEAEEFAQSSGIELIDGSVRVIIECESGQVEVAAKSVSAFGTVELTTRKLVQAIVAITKLTALAEAEGIRFIRLPVYAGEEDN